MGTGLTSLGTMSYVALVFINKFWFVPSVCGKQPYLLGNSLGCLRVPMGPLWPTTQLDVMQFQNWKLPLVTKDGQLGF